MLAFVCGIVAAERDFFPAPIVRDIPTTLSHVLVWSGVKWPWYYQRSAQTRAIVTHAVGRVAPGLRLIAGLGAHDETVVRVIDAEGTAVHSWRLEWRRMWPSPDHLPVELRGEPVLVHGMALAPDGDLIFNFDERGMVRVDPCGQVRWRVPYRTHHSVELDARGDIWASGLISRTEGPVRLPKYSAPFEDYTVLKISPDGHILDEWFVAELLIENGLTGLLYMASTANDTEVGGDTLHLNDIEVFPDSLTPGVFAPGDVMISLRNINAILVVDPNSRKMKYVSVGAVLRQHDPDFVDGNTISVFDNNNLSVTSTNFFVRLRGTRVDPAGHYSRIITLSALTGRTKVLFAGSARRPFFTHIMGRHQLMPNGGGLIVEAAKGRVLEIDAQGDVVWEYFNLVGNGRIGAINDALVLPAAMDRKFFAAVTAACSPGSLKES
jgi:hypothetical protein